jgi:hypothetical protein
MLQRFRPRWISAVVVGRHDDERFRFFVDNPLATQLRLYASPTLGKTIWLQLLLNVVRRRMLLFVQLLLLRIRLMNTQPVLPSPFPRYRCAALQ